jgi:hypothetical protein
VDCAGCGAALPPTASACPRCGRLVRPPGAGPAAPIGVEVPAGGRTTRLTCPNCGTIVYAELGHCPNCQLAVPGELLPDRWKGWAFSAAVATVLAVLAVAGFFLWAHDVDRRLDRGDGATTQVGTGEDESEVPDVEGVCRTGKGVATVGPFRRGDTSQTIVSYVPLVRGAPDPDDLDPIEDEGDFSGHEPSPESDAGPGVHAYRLPGRLTASMLRARAVLCLDLVRNGLTRPCVTDQNGPLGDTTVAWLEPAQWTGTFRELRTGRMIGRTTVTATAFGCPSWVEPAAPGQGDLAAPLPERGAVEAAIVAFD